MLGPDPGADLKFAAVDKFAGSGLPTQRAELDSAGHARWSQVRSPSRVRKSSATWPSGKQDEAMWLNAVPGPSSKAFSVPADRHLSRHAVQSMVVDI